MPVKSEYLGISSKSINDSYSFDHRVNVSFAFKNQKSIFNFIEFSCKKLLGIPPGREWKSVETVEQKVGLAVISWSTSSGLALISPPISSTHK